MPHRNAAAAVSIYMIVVLVVLAVFARRIAGMTELDGRGERKRSLFRRLQLSARMKPVASPAE